MSFDVLQEKIIAKQNPTVAGLDARIEYVPEHIRKAAFAQYGVGLKGACEAIWQFNVGLIDALCDVVPAVKPQSAYYENLGWQGMEMLERTIRYAREKGLFVIKPSGVDYDKLTPDDMVVMDLEGNRVEGTLNPSSDTKTHLILYNRFPKIGGVVHTHSPWATSWAQAGRDIPCYGTTHADYIYGSVPCARNLNEEELKNYEWNTGVLIADLFEERKLDPMAVPCVLCKNHGPFTWGKDAHEAVHNAVVLEEVAKMAARCEMINPDVKEAPQCLQDKHYLRKHGPGAYYGQGNL